MVIAKFLDLWDLSEVELQPEVEDSPLIWKSWASGKCKFFMWLVAHNRCWTANHLAKKNLLHPECCPLCDQEEETIDHLLVSCVFTRQFWLCVLQSVGLQALTPQLEVSFDDWWDAASNRVESQAKKGLNSIIILGAWSIWIHRNRCVFDGIPPNLNGVLSVLIEEMRLWSVVAARGVSHLLALPPLQV